MSQKTLAEIANVKQRLYTDVGCIIPLFQTLSWNIHLIIDLHFALDILKPEQKQKINY